MKKLILLILGSIIAATAVGQTRTFGIVEYFENGDSIRVKKLVTQVIYISEGTTTKMVTPPDTARLFIGSDGAIYEGTIIWHKRKAYTLKERVDDASNRVAVANMVRYKNLTKSPATYEHTFTAAQNVSVAASASIEFTGDKIELWSERFKGHGTITIWVDNVKRGELNQGQGEIKDGVEVFEPDIARGRPSFVWEFPDGGFHKIEVRGGLGSQFIIDFFDVYQKQ